MKCFILFVTLFGTIQLSLTEGDESNKVIYNFYTADNKDKATVIRSDDTQKLSDAGFDVKQKTIFLIYNFEEPSLIESQSNLKDGILGEKSVNVFLVDWSEVSTGINYIVAQSDIITVGQYVANFIQILIDKFSLDQNDVTIIGWDLGAHIAGIAGKNLTKKISTIIGLDPSGPLFTTNDKSNRLVEDDAQFVQVIHTNSVINGFGDVCGTADYYPNEGTIQKSCGNDITGVCSHKRALSFFAESLTSKKFVACTDYEKYKKNTCEDKEKSIMGGLEVDTSAKGQYFLDTNDKSPYAKG